jgi:hypothetical protein
VKTYLIEAYSDEIEFDTGSIIIALTPEVCYQLDKKGIKYSIIEDYYDVVALSGRVEEYRLSVFRWIDDFDRFLRNNIKGLDLKLATIYRWYLKGAVLDPIYLRCYELRHLFDNLMPTEVTYVTPEPDAPQLNPHFENYGRSLYSQIIPILCREKNIRLTTVFYETNRKKVNTNNPASQSEGLISRLKKIAVKNKTIMRIYFIFRYLRKLPQLKRARQKKINIFIVRLPQIGEDLIAEAIARGHHVYLLSGDVIFKYSWFGTRKHLKLKPNDALSGEYNWENAANSLANSEILKWVNKKCQSDISEVVLPRLRYFILRVCPELDHYIKEFIEFYEKDSIDLLFTPVIFNLEDYGALAAAKRYTRIKTACLVHGDGVCDSRVWNITELQNYYIHISSNIETKEYFQRLANEIHSSARLYSNPYRLRKVIEIAYAREKRKTRVIPKNRAIYIPLFMIGDYIRMEGGSHTDTWYYQFQKSLIEYFSTREDYTFVWKGLPQGDKIYNPIPDFIRDNHFNNIEIATNAFIDHLLTADRVICDCPSTGFYEAVIAGVPVMSLYHASLIMRQAAVEHFKDLLRLFNETSDAIKHIDDFLNSDDLRQYQMKMDMEKGSIFDILEGINQV